MSIDPATTATHPAPKVRRPPRCRARLWELDERLHLPLLCVCLTPEVLLQIANRFAFHARSDDETAQLIEAAEASRSRSPVSEALQRHLETRFKRWVDRFALLADDLAVGNQWQHCQLQGQIAGPLWATCTHRATSSATRLRAACDVQLLGCRSCACQLADARQTDHLQSENARLREALHLQSIAHATELDALRTTVDQLRRQLTQQASPPSSAPGPTNPLHRKASGMATRPSAPAPQRPI